MMTRRLFNSVLATAALPNLSDRNLIETDGVKFAWSHRDGRVWCELSAPIQGWIAAGFNRSPELHGTQFVIADLASMPPTAEIHVALVPNHRRVEELGGQADLVIANSNQKDGHSHLVYSLPEQLLHPFPLDLRSGHAVTLMLAWSVAREFDHHSAWRKHFQITL